MELGTVISSIDGPSTQGFSFVISERSVRKGQFVQINSEQGIVIAVINEIYRANRYFEKAESVSEYTKNGINFLDNFPAGEWEYIIAECGILGVFHKLLKRTVFPPSPGDKVQDIDLNVLKEFLGFEENGINLGSLLQHNVEVKLGINRLLQKHLAILGISGSGKSFCSCCLLEELLDRPKEHGRIAAVVFDSHGDYLGFAEKPYNDRTEVIDGKKIRIATHKVNVEMFKEMLPEITGSASRELEVILQEMKEKMKEGQKAFDLNELIKAVEESSAKESVKAPLASWLYGLRKMNLFSRVDYPNLKELIKPGKLIVFDFSEVNSIKKKQIIVAYFGKKLFSLRRKEKIPPFLLLIEEAHNFAREKAPKEGAISKGIIETIAREGRKFGACLCLVSQRPIQLSTTALSQCNSFIIMRITNPYDLDHIGKSCEAIDKSTLDSITTLKVGEGIVLGEAINYPVFIKVRNKKSSSGGKGESLETLAKRFDSSQKEEITDSDLEVFL